MSTPAQIMANLINAQHSTGPGMPQAEENHYPELRAEAQLREITKRTQSDSQKRTHFEPLTVHNAGCPCGSRRESA